MNKITYIIAVLLMSLFNACSQEESLEPLDGNSQVNFSLELPASVASTLGNSNSCVL